MRLGDMVIRGGSVHMLVALSISISITMPMSSIPSMSTMSSIASIASVPAVATIARLSLPLSIAMMPPIVAPMMGVVDVEAILVVGRGRVVSMATMPIATMSIATMSKASVSRVYLGHMDRGGAVVAIGTIG